MLFPWNTEKKGRGKGRQPPQKTEYVMLAFFFLFNVFFHVNKNRKPFLRIEEYVEVVHQWQRGGLWLHAEWTESHPPPPTIQLALKSKVEPISIPVLNKLRFHRTESDWRIVKNWMLALHIKLWIMIIWNIGMRRSVSKSACTLKRTVMKRLLFFFFTLGSPC